MSGENVVSVAVLSGCHTKQCTITVASLARPQTSSFRLRNEIDLREEKAQYFIVTDLSEFSIECTKTYPLSNPTDKHEKSGFQENSVHSFFNTDVGPYEKKM